MQPKCHISSNRGVQNKQFDFVTLGFTLYFLHRWQSTEGTTADDELAAFDFAAMAREFGLQSRQTGYCQCLGHSAEKEARPMSQPPHRVLSVALRIFSVLLAIGGLFMIFGSRGLVIRVLLHPPEAEVSTLLLFALKEMGGMALMVSTTLFLASRDPERNVATVDGLIVGLVILAVTPLLSLYTVGIQRVYPAHLVWGRSAVRLMFAVFFFYLRPREARWRPVGNH